ncbi:hypothetical protein V1281_003286 [Nitrobacteraceae bacterium AZCC 2161]
MSAAAHGQLVGRWRIVEADLGDRDYLSLQAGRDCHWSRQPRGNSLRRPVAFEYRNGDEAVLKAKREAFSTAC